MLFSLPFRKGLPRFLLLASLVWLLLPGGRVYAQPPGFVDEVYATGFAGAIGLVFDDLGRSYVWEKNGRIFVVENGIKSPAPLLDISDEVGGWRDFGLLSVALDPNFFTNGHIYLLYTVDTHHLLNFEDANNDGIDDNPATVYNPATNQYFDATIGRITRYTVTNPTAAADVMTVDEATRFVLLGRTAADGFPSTHQSHHVGTLLFGTDGTLLATNGDGASYSSTDVGSATETYYANAIAYGVITPAHNIGAYRCQIASSLSGKMVRIDPATGNGIPSNPLYQAGSPRSAESRLWARGLRNPCRMAMRPNTGSHNPADADPGVFYVGDVGWGGREDMTVIDGPNQNAGWPAFEGMTLQNGGYQNPAYLPGSGSIPAHKLPALDWRGGTARAYSVSTGIVNAGSAQFPGPNFTGNCSMGGVWYTGTDFPAEYQNTYFHLDYGAQWIMNFPFDANDDPIESKAFIPNAGSVTAVATSPTEGGLFYVNNGSTVHRVRYSPGNLPPVAKADAAPLFGPSALSVQFQGNLSFDPEGLPLTYAWDFGDGSPIDNTANPSHVYTASVPGQPEQFDVTLTVTDANLEISTAHLVVSVNNTPPVIQSTSLDGISSYSMTSNTILNESAVVTDAEHAVPAEITYAWQSFLFHDNHNHPEPVDNNETSTAVLSPVGCDDVLYFYRIKLNVTDAAGLSDSVTYDFYPDCGGPIARNDTAGYLFGSSIVVDVLDNDQPNGGTIDASTVTILKQPVHGTLSVNPTTGAVTYTHNGLSSAPDLFQYKVANTLSDESGVAQVWLTRGGPPAIVVNTPQENDVIFSQEIPVQYSSFGGLNGDEQVRLTLDANPPVLLPFVNGAYTFTGVAYGPHSLLVELVDASAVPLGNPEASTTISFQNAVRPEPGGVGSGLTMWYRADAGVSLGAGTSVATWGDQSLGGQDVTQGDLAAQPTWVSNALNGNPALSFDGGDYLDRPGVPISDLVSATEFTMVVAQRSGEVVTVSHGIPGENTKLVMEGCGNRMFAYSVNLDGRLLPGAIPCDEGNISLGVASRPNFELFVNGNSLLTSAALTGVPIMGSTSLLRVGGYNENLSYNLVGEVGEIVLYDRALSLLEQQQVQSYLAIKYGISLDPVTHLFYSHTTHSHDIAGIGRDALTMDLLQTSSMSINSDAILRMSNPSAMVDGEYLVWGNDNGTTDLVYTELPVGVPGRIGRTWRVEETGEVGTVDISFSINNLGVPVAGAAGVFLLVDDTDSDFSDVTPITATSLVNGVATFTGINLNDGAYLGLGLEVACAPWCNDFTPVGAGSVGSLGCFELTPATGNLAGAVWFDSLANFNSDFRMEIDLFLGDADAGADGVTFSLQNAGTAALGGAGGAMGIGGIAPSFSVEFDTWQNAGELAADHISVFYNGSQANVLVPAVQASATSANVEDGLYHRVIFDWDAALNKLDIFFDGSLRATYTGDLVADYFGGNPWLTFGLTGGTGGAVNVHAFCLIDLAGTFRDPNGCAPFCDDFQTVNNAVAATAGCYDLTPAVNWRSGAMWFDSLMNLNETFYLEFDVNFGTDDAGADGITFTMQQKGRMDMGTPGIGMGVGGMTPALSVEFDTYQNAGEVPDDHIMIYTDGSPVNSLTTAVCASATCANIEDGGIHSVVLTWDPATEILEVYLDGSLRTTLNHDLVNSVFGGNPNVYFGFTGSTGGFNNNQRVCVVSLDGDFAEAADLFVGATPAEYDQNGDASGNRLTCVRVTDEIDNQASTAWNPTRVDLNDDFRIEFFHHAGADDAGADGSAFLFHNDARGTTALGALGSNLGVGGPAPVTPSIGVEFDTYNSTSSGFPEIPEDHVAIFQNGDILSRLAGDNFALPGGGNIEDGQYRRGIVDWDATAQTLNVFYDGVLVATYTGDIVTNIFGGTPFVYYGFSGGTGGLNNMCEFCITALSATFENTSFPVEWSAFTATPVDEQVLLNWSTSSEQNNDYFTVERSADGLHFEALMNVPGAGTSQTPQHYEAVDASPLPGRSYYRLRQTDFDGKVAYSDKVQVYFDLVHFRLTAFPNPTGGQEQLRIGYTLAEGGQARLDVFNAQGQLVYRGTETAFAGENTRTLKVHDWAQGVYQVRLTVDGRSQLIRVVVD